MKIEDRIYGTHEINSRLFLDLINSKAVQRLKDISQLGMPDEYYHIKGFSRYEHSLGVGLLLKHLGANMEEQIAGLLHDISHTPFSHVVDWALGDPTKEDYQDKNHKKFLENSDIPPILKRNSIDLERISNYKNFTLLEREAPSLCADRIDYSLREIVMKNKKKLAEEILNSLSVKNNQIVFLDKISAEKFGREYALLQKKHWGGDEARARYYLLSEAIKEAFKQKIIGLEDLNGTEGEILKKLNSSKNGKIPENLLLLRKGFQIVYDPVGIEIKKKFRHIDPEVLVNGAYTPLSKLSNDYHNLLELEKKENFQFKKIKIIPL